MAPPSKSRYPRATDFPLEIGLSEYVFNLSSGEEYLERICDEAFSAVGKHGSVAAALDAIKEAGKDPQTAIMNSVTRHILENIPSIAEGPGDAYIHLSDEKGGALLTALLKGYEDAKHDDLDFDYEREEHQDGRVPVPTVLDAPEGVAHVARALSIAELDSMNVAVNRYRDAQPAADYHPGSNQRVRDILHPSMHPYIAPANTDEEKATIDTDLNKDACRTSLASLSTVKSGFVPNIQFDADKQRYAERLLRIRNEYSPMQDEFARTWRGSRYQWMPTDVSISKAGMARFAGPLNALDAEIDQDVIQHFETILSKMVPMWEYVLGYTAAARWDHFMNIQEEDVDDLEVKPASLRGRTIQVIPKIADIEIKPGGGPEFHEGVWHVEGLSHEHIVSTGIAYLQIEDGILGGRLRFRRPFLPDEAAELKYNISQEFGKLSPGIVAGILRLGSVEPAPGDIVVFPNSHQHKLERITARRPLSSLPSRSRSRESAPANHLVRRIVCFFLVNPEERIVSTSDVEVLPSHVLDYETACRVREAMMKERALLKKDLNRDFYHNYNFCEH
eukprot:ANDGO_07690.mRNA.1 hypothetical protein SARC_01085